MPIQGKFYTTKELQTLWKQINGRGCTRQYIQQEAAYRGWPPILPGLYCAEPIERDFLALHGIDLTKLEVKSYKNPL